MIFAIRMLVCFFVLLASVSLHMGTTDLLIYNLGMAVLLALLAGQMEAVRYRALRTRR